MTKYGIEPLYDLEASGDKNGDTVIPALVKQGVVEKPTAGSILILKEGVYLGREPIPIITRLSSQKYGWGDSVRGVARLNLVKE